MGDASEFSYLAYLPTHIFKDLIWNWEQLSIEFEPNGLLSNENRAKVIEITEKLKFSKINQLKKLSKILNISDTWWQVYQILKVKPLSELLGKEKEFNVDNYIEKESFKIKGLFSIIELSEHAVLILIEFSSRSKSSRKKFRYIYLPSVKIILLEPKNLSLEIMRKEILPLITKEPENVTHKMPNARFIRNLTKSSDNSRTPLPLNFLKIRLSLETSGVEGLNQITIEGNDVIRGAETLEQRHEISLKFMSSGPWVGGGTKDFKFEVGRGVQILQLEEKSQRNLATELSRL